MYRLEREASAMDVQRKKQFTTRIDEGVLAVAQRLADAERRSVTSMIEVAVLEYERRGTAPPERASHQSPVFPAIVAMCSPNQDDMAPDNVPEAIAETVGNALNTLNIYVEDVDEEAGIHERTLVDAFGGADYVKKVFAWREAVREWRTKRGKHKGNCPVAPPLPVA
jgi:hypothetical protein